MHGAADAVAAEVGVQAVTGCPGYRADRRGYVAEPPARHGRGDPGRQRALGSRDQPQIGRPRRCRR